jgi:thymidylate synthase
VKPFEFETACRAYVRKKGNMTKPSYIGRIRSFEFFKQGRNSWEGIDQIARVLDKFAIEPQASNLGISIFHPDDLTDAFRPGYVPCLSFIDVKYRQKMMRMKFFFRSCDIGEGRAFRCIFLPATATGGCSACEGTCATRAY